MKHGYYPSVWLHPNILIIASYIENCMESYDLRRSHDQQQQINQESREIWKVYWSCQACTFINSTEFG